MIACHPIVLTVAAIFVFSTNQLIVFFVKQALSRLWEVASSLSTSMLLFRRNVSFTSKTGGFESKDSHQLLCSWKVEVNSEPFCIARFPRGFYTHLDLFGGSKMVQYDWLLASQSGCCRFDPVCPKAWVVFFLKVNI